MYISEQIPVSQEANIQNVKADILLSPSAERMISKLQFQSVQQLDISRNGFLYFMNHDIFIGCM